MSSTSAAARSVVVVLLRAVAKRRWRRGFLPREPSTSQFPRWVVAVLWLYLQGAPRQWSSLVALASRVPAGVAAGWIRLDLGLSIPAPPGAIGGCSASRRVEDVTGVWEKSMVDRLCCWPRQRRRFPSFPS